MNDVYIRLGPLHKRQGFLQLKSVRGILLGRAATFDDHVGHGLSHRFQHRQWEAHPVLQAAAIGIRPVVGGGGQKLRQQIIVGAVDHDDLQSRLLAANGAIHKLLPDIGHVFLVHGLDIPQWPAVQGHI